MNEVPNDGVDATLLQLEANVLAARAELKIHMMKGELLFGTRSVTSPSAKELERVRNSTIERAANIKQQAW